MNIIKTTSLVAFLVGSVALTTLSGCISVKREVEPSTTSTTTTSSTVVPGSSVTRTTTY